MLQRFQLPLSGSQERHRVLTSPKPHSCFQLPLSGSLQIIDFLTPILTIAFQLPLSGSRVPLQFRRDSGALWAFNSLSRDHVALLHVAEVHVARYFQLPLSGSLESACYTTPAINLSTPSLGITEPDSGIFRLSAAFCRGAPSHK